MQTLNWGLIGCGDISRKRVAPALRDLPNCELTAVNRASFHDPEINRSYGMMASHYGVGVLPARPRRPKDKAKVENAVRFAQNCILRHSRLASASKVVAMVIKPPAGV